MTTAGVVITSSLVVALLALLAVTFLIRRQLLLRGIGAVEMSIKVQLRWSVGVGWYGGEELSWYRVFSLSPRPAKVFVRGRVEVLERVPATERDAIVLPRGSTVLRCRTGQRTEDIAMSAGAANGLLSWLEAAPPGYPNRDVPAG